MNSGKHQKFNVKQGQASTVSPDVGLKHRATAIYERITSIGLQDCLIEVDWHTDRQPLVECDAYKAPTAEQMQAWPSAVLPTKVLTPKGGYSAAGGSSGIPVMLVAVMGRDTDQLEGTVRQIELQQQQSNNFIPLFLTNNPCHRVFRQAGYNFEYFPSGVYCKDTQRELFQQKFLNIWSKWKAETLVDLSEPGFLKARLDEVEKFTQREPVTEKTYNSRRKRPAARPSPPTDVAALKAEYLTKGLDQTPDTFVLYRILGNDLPPRHRAGQTLENLKFILEHEPQFENCEKRWVVNRIIDPAQEKPILEMLEQQGQPYLRIPFELGEYRKQDWDFASFPRLDFFLNGPYVEMSEYDQQRAEANIRRNKNRYAINNNGARNAALRDGRDRAKWVLPWDGNCFLTAGAWAEIADGVVSAPYMKYFTVPMARTLDNSDLLQSAYRPESEDEPQILFRSDASEEFDEEFPYGRRPKVELFLRLGITGRWDRWYDDKWDLPRPDLAEEAGTCGNAGWVSRLFSGQGELEGAATADLRSRGVARITAVNSMLDQLDQTAAKTIYDPNNLTAYDQDKILALKTAPAGSPKGKTLGRLVQEAELALQRGPYSVVDKLSTSPSNDKHDYFNPAPYYWPNPNTANGLPMVFRDGDRIPGTRLYDPESDHFDRTRLQRMFDDTTVLALAWKATGDSRYADHGAQNIRHWFLDETSRMNPHLEHAQANSKETSKISGKSGLIEMKDLYFLLDAIRLLEQSGSLNINDKMGLREWLSEYLNWLLTSDQGVAERISRNNHGTCYDLQTASIAAFLGDQALLQATFRTSRERMMTQFEETGNQTYEMERTQTAHYCCFNLQSWVNLVNLAALCGDDLWQVEGPKAQGLAAAFGWLLPYQAKEDWPFKQIEPFDRDRFLPLFFAAKDLCGNIADKDGARPEQAKPLFFPHDGIKPFWTLGVTPLASLPSRPHAALAQVVARAESPVVDCIVNTGRKGCIGNIGLLDKKLWGGFSRSARQELEAIKTDPEATQAQINTSARVLARWYYTVGDYQRTLDNVQEMRGLDAVNQREQSVLRAYCLDQLGQSTLAGDIVRQTHLSFPGNSNLCLSMANVMGGLNKGLEWLNAIYHDARLQPAALSNSTGAMGLTSLSFAKDTAPVHTNADGPLVSVIVPVAPQHHEPIGALQSLRQQTWGNLEILIVEYSGNPDLSQAIKGLASGDSRIQIVPAGQIQSDDEARNLGLKSASGKYVTTLDPGEIAHPEKIVTQVRKLEAGTCQAVLTCHATVTPGMKFVAGWHPEFSLVPVQSSSLMISTDVLLEMGGWDAVDTDPDPFLIWRLKETLGNTSVQVAMNRIPLSFSAMDDRGDLPCHLNFPYGRRRDHFKKMVRMVRRQAEQDTEEGTVSMMPCPPRMSNSGGEFDRVYIGDFARNSIGVSVLMEQLSSVHPENLKIGIFNWPDYNSEWNNTLDLDLAELIDVGTVAQISGHEMATARVLVLCNPYVIRHFVDGLPQFNPKRVEVLCGPQISRAEMFNGLRCMMPTASEIETVFNAPCKWVAV